MLKNTVKRSINILLIYKKTESFLTKIKKFKQKKNIKEEK